MYARKVTERARSPPPEMPGFSRTPAKYAEKVRPLATREQQQLAFLHLRVFWRMADPPTFIQAGLFTTAEPLL
jgi:hypothetical protein